MRIAWTVALVLVACSDSASSNPSNPSPDASTGGESDAGSDAASGTVCPDGFPRGSAAEARRVVELTPQPEGVAVCANGDVFVSIPDEGKVLRVPLTGGTPEVWTTLTGRQPLGMTCVGNVLYVADFRAQDAAVVRITAKDDPGTPLPKIEGDEGYSGLNAVVAVPGVGLYASDRSNKADGRVVLFSETSAGVFRASVAKSGLAYPNGVAFEPVTRTLDVAQTLEAKVLSYPISNGGELGEASPSWSGTPVADAIDGIARDENKALYIAHYVEGYIGRPDGAKLATALNPKSLAFRGGTLLFTSADGLHAVDLGVCGAHP